MNQFKRLWWQFGLRGLLITITLCAAALGIVRWLWIFVNDRPHHEVLVQATEARGSMEPTLNGREILAPDMHAYWNAKPARLEMVVFGRSGANTGRVLRVIGLPGETVSFTGGKVVIDGQVLVLPLQLQKIKFHCDLPDVEFVSHPYTVPEGCYYVLGDNPDKADDSRMWGGLPAEKIIGRVYGSRQANR